MPSPLATEIRALPRDHPHYPPGLRDLEDAPPVLYARGALPPPFRSAIALVGSRAASPYGRSMAERLAADLARLGFAVISGLARGIDAAAHRGAMAAGGATWAVLPSGVDEITPRHHHDLGISITARGGLLSEIPAGTRAQAWGFVRRNRLIAALSAATVVVEAAARSGALWTAAAARTLGRAVLAVPGDVDRETTRGCHALIRRGALLCEGVSDVVRAIERGLPEGEPVPTAAAGASAETRLLRALSSTPESLESLARAAEVEVAEAMGALLALEWSGVARSAPGQRWARVDP